MRRITVHATATLLQCDNFRLYCGISGGLKRLKYHWMPASRFFWLSLQKYTSALCGLCMRIKRPQLLCRQ